MLQWAEHAGGQVQEDFLAGKFFLQKTHRRKYSRENIDRVMSKDPRTEFDSTPHAPTEIPQHIMATARTLAERGLGRAALLFVMGHAPLAFMAGTLLHGVAPLYGLLTGGMQGQLSNAGRRLDEWGDFLGEPLSLAALRPHLLLEDGPRGPVYADTAETHACVERDSRGSVST